MISASWGPALLVHPLQEALPGLPGWAGGPFLHAQAVPWWSSGLSCPYQATKPVLHPDFRGERSHIPPALPSQAPLRPRWALHGGPHESLLRFPQEDRPLMVTFPKFTVRRGLGTWKSVSPGLSRYLGGSSCSQPRGLWSRFLIRSQPAEGTKRQREWGRGWRCSSSYTPSCSVGKAFLPPSAPGPPPPAAGARLSCPVALSPPGDSPGFVPLATLPLPLPPHPALLR